MIFANEAELISFGDIDVGKLALSFGFGHQGLPVLICGPADAKRYFRLRREFYSAEGDYRNQMAQLGTPVARFDPDSALTEEELPYDGTLILTPEGPGIFESTGRIRSVGGHLVRLSGERIPFYRDRDAPAFCNWQIGFMREQEFVLIAAIDARPIPTES